MFQNLNHLDISDEFSISNNGKLILLSGQTQSLFRYSNLSKYFVYNVSQHKLLPIADSSFLRTAVFSPTNDKVAYVKDNNLFVQTIESGKALQITSDGKINAIINGVPDWVYEEEFTLKNAFQWSPDGKYIALYRFDESQVKEYPLITYENNIYPKINYLKYPKAGEKNSLVEIFVFNTNSGEIIKMNIGNDSDCYIPRIRWNLKSKQLAVVRMNRLQNKLDILLNNPDDGLSKIIYHEENEKYIDELPENYPIFIDNAGHFLISSEKNGYNHIYLCNTENNKQIQLTKGSFDVREVFGYNKTSKLIFYSASEKSPTHTEVYSIRVDGTNKQCLSLKDGMNEPVFSPGFQFFLNEHSNHSSPYECTLQKSNGSLLMMLMENEDLNNKVKNAQIPLKDFFNFTTSDGITLNGWIIKPVNFDSTKKYPVVMYVYGGPGRQTVEDSWKINWANYLATQEIIVVSVDGRGTNGRGEAFKKITYRNLGYYETIDQIETAKYLKKLNYIDA